MKLLNPAAHARGFCKVLEIFARTNMHLRSTKFSGRALEVLSNEAKVICRHQSDPTSMYTYLFTKCGSSVFRPFPFAFPSWSVHPMSNATSAKAKANIRLRETSLLDFII